MNAIPDAQVPCGSCRLCCRKESIFLMPERGDIVEAYLTEEVNHPFAPGGRGFALQHKPNGDCVYLDEATGCTIHERAPAICRVFDCRAFYANTPRDERRRRASTISGAKAIYARGRELIRTAARG